MPSSLSSLVDNLAGINTDDAKCCKGGDIEFIEIDDAYMPRFECGKCY